MPAASEVTRGLRDVRSGVPGAFDRLIDLLYDDLRAIAGKQLAGNGDWTINPTALVHEAYLRLAERTSLDVGDRAQFFAVCAVVMRNLVVDFARRRSADKRGGGRERVTLDDSVLRVDSQAEQILALDQALRRLQAVNPRYVRVAECRFFGGLSEPETASALGVSERTVRRDWRKGRALLQGILAEAGDERPGA